MSYLNKVVLVTGAGSGIGEKTALHFAKLSARLALIDSSNEVLKKSIENCEKAGRTKVFKAVADLTKDEEVKKAIEATVKHYGRIDVLVNGTDVFGPGTIHDKDLIVTFDKVMAINIRATIAVIHYAAPALIESKGSVINISSAYADVILTNIPYSTAKATLNHITRCIALDLGSKGVRVNSVSPGFMGSGLENKSWDLASPLKKSVKIEDVTELIAFLASDKARGITGVNYSIDSGLTLAGAGNNDIVKQMEKLVAK